MGGGGGGGGGERLQLSSEAGHENPRGDNKTKLESCNKTNSPTHTIFSLETTKQEGRRKMRDDRGGGGGEGVLA